MNLYYFFVGLILFSAVSTAVLAWLAWRKNTDLSRIFALLLLSIAWWGLNYGIESLAVELTDKLFLARLKYFGVISCPVLLLAFVLKYVQQDQFLRAKYLILSLVIPLITLVAVWTDPWHHLFYTQVYLDLAFNPPILHTDHGFFFWLHSGFSYLMLMSSVIILVDQTIHSRGRLQGQQGLVLFATVIPVFGNALHIFNLSPYPILDLTTLAFPISGLLLYISIFQMHLLDISPTGRRMTVENMQDGMLVLDHENRITDLNPAFEHWLALSAERLIGRPAVDVLPAGFAQCLVGMADTPSKIEIETYFQGQVRTLEAHSSTIRSQHNLPTGRVILLRDVTERKKFEQSLQQAKEALEKTNLALVEALDLNQQVFSASPIGILAFEVSGQCVMVNEAVAKILKLPVEQLLNSSYHAFSNWQQNGLVEAAQTVFTTQKPFQGVFRFMQPDGDGVWVECSMAFFTRQEQPHLLMMVHDITAQRMAEEERQRSELRFHGLVDSMNDVVFTLDRDGRYTGIYGKWLKDSNLQPSEFLGRSATDVFGEEGGKVHAQASRQVLEGNPVIYEWSSLRNGVRQFYQTSLSPMFEGNRVTGIVGVGRDVTGLKNLEKDLADAKALLEQAFEQSLAPMVLISTPAGVVEMINRACIKTLRLPDAGELVGQFIYNRSVLWDIRDSEGWPIPENRRPIEVAMRGETISNVEYLFRFADGSQGWILMNASPIYNKSGEQIAALLVFIDITDRKQFERAEREQRVIAEAFRDTAAIMNSTIQLDTVITLVLGNIERVVPHDAAHLILFDEEGKINSSRSRGYIGDEEQQAFELSQLAASTPGWSEKDSVPSAIIQSDVAVDPDVNSRIIFSRLHTFLHVPIRFKNNLVGLITLSSVQPAFYTQVHAGRLQVFADQAAVAIENARLYTEVQHLTLTDELTRVYNYRGLIELGQREFDRARRFNRPLSVLFYDIDHFRDFNNRYTHAVGNQVLQATTRITRSYLRGVDLVARFGGEEFVVLLPETKLGNAVEIAERLREEVEETYVQTKYGRLNVTISIGVAAITDDTQSLNALIDRANQAEHHAKQAGRNRVSITPLRGSTVEPPPTGDLSPKDPQG